jgi:hypothetical protein
LFFSSSANKKTGKKTSIKNRFRNVFIVFILSDLKTTNLPPRFNSEVINKSGTLDKIIVQGMTIDKKQITKNFQLPIH